jgi:putative NIF3 family GTP cyclohydrolase 1 type 2
MIQGRHFEWSRRSLGKGLLALGAAVSLPVRAAPSRLSVGELIARIKAQCAREGIAWMPETVDTLKIGSPDQPVTGVVTTFMATLDLMRSAAARNANFIISHEPVFFSHSDTTATLQQDPVYRAKMRFAEERGLAVWRFHDHFHRLQPEPMSTASIRDLGWQGYATAEAGFGRLFVRPPISLAGLAREMAQRLPSRSIRVIGDPAMIVRSMINIGHRVDGVAKGLERADVAIGAEVREFDSAEYMRDLLRSGQRKALIMIAHERGEESGMELCQNWVRKFVPEVPVTFISSKEPFQAYG